LSEKSRVIQLRKNEQLDFTNCKISSMHDFGFWSTVFCDVNFAKQKQVEQKINNPIIKDNIKDGKQVNILNDQDFKSKIESKYKTTGKEDWLNIISPYLIFIGEIETNRNQTMSERMGAAYQCHLSTKLIRLPDGKELIYSDIFSVKEKVVVDSISKYLKDNKIKFKESDLELTGESLVQFYALNNYEFSLIDTKSIADSCNPLFDKKIPINIISPFLTKWIKQQLQIFT
jgi:hypothetical protein